MTFDYDTFCDTRNDVYGDSKSSRGFIMFFGRNTLVVVNHIKCLFKKYVFLEREPFFGPSAEVMGFAEQDKIEGWIGGTTVTTIFYLLSKALSGKQAEKHIRKLLKIFHVSSINRVVLEKALENHFKDYEEGVLYQSAIHANPDGHYYKK